MTRKERFIQDYAEVIGVGYEVTKLVIAVKLDTGAIELIINTELIDNKIKYYESAYNDNLELNYNNEIRIIDWLIV